MTQRFVVRGQVQGVGYRYYVVNRARDLGLHGWVRNLPDGRVEVVADGPEASLTALEASLREGPRLARVAGVEKSEISDEIDATKSFDIK